MLPLEKEQADSVREPSHLPRSSTNRQCLTTRKLRPWRSGPNRKTTNRDKITVPSNSVRAQEYPSRSRKAYSIETAGEANKTPSWYTKPGNRLRIASGESSLRGAGMTPKAPWTPACIKHEPAINTPTEIPCTQG